SHREARVSRSMRPRPRLEREPSPKRYRREGERGYDRLQSRSQLDRNGDEFFRKQSRLQESFSRDTPLEPHPKSETAVIIKEPENRDEGLSDHRKHPSDPTKVPRSRSYFQHDDRGVVGESGRSINHRPWRYPKDQPSNRAESYSHQTDDLVWRHDGYIEMEANPKPIINKRPSFREQKIQPEPENLIARIRADQGRKVLYHSAETVRNDHRWYPSDRVERSAARERDLNRAEPWGGRRYKEPERFPPRPDYRRPIGGRVEKWKHDLYNEANRSPSPKNEEEKISKIEALLAS
ncbi:hypothetical protein M569_00973, partial [Genlisea aurea]